MPSKENTPVALGWEAAFEYSDPGGQHPVCMLVKTGSSFFAVACVTRYDVERNGRRSVVDDGNFMPFDVDI